MTWRGAVRTVVGDDGLVGLDRYDWDLLVTGAFCDRDALLLGYFDSPERRDALTAAIFRAELDAFQGTEPVSLHVDPTRGDDTNDGSRERPLRTFAELNRRLCRLQPT